MLYIIKKNIDFQNIEGLIVFTSEGLSYNINSFIGFPNMEGSDRLPLLSFSNCLNVKMSITIS